MLDDAIRNMTRRGAQVINLSLGSPDKTAGDWPDTHDALLIADDRDVVVVAASGNGKVGVLDFPANDSGMAFAVGGVQPPLSGQPGGPFWDGWEGNFEPFRFGSNWSPTTTLQQFVAPAAQVLSSMYPGKDWYPTDPVFCGDNVPSAGFYPG